MSIKRNNTTVNKVLIIVKYLKENDFVYKSDLRDLLNLKSTGNSQLQYYIDVMLDNEIIKLIKKERPRKSDNDNREWKYYYTVLIDDEKEIEEKIIKSGEKTNTSKLYHGEIISRYNTVIDFMKSHNNITVNELSEKLNISPSNMYHIVRNLTIHGIVKKLNLTRNQTYTLLIEDKEQISKLLYSDNSPVKSNNGTVSKSKVVDVLQYLLDLNTTDDIIDIKIDDVCSDMMITDYQVNYALYRLRTCKIIDRLGVRSISKYERIYKYKILTRDIEQIEINLENKTEIYTSKELDELVEQLRLKIRKRLRQLIPKLKNDIIDYIKENYSSGIITDTDANYISGKTLPKSIIAKYENGDLFDENDNLK